MKPDELIKLSKTFQGKGITAPAKPTLLSMFILGFITGLVVGIILSLL